VEEVFVDPKYCIFDLGTKPSNQERQSAAKITHSECDVPIGEVVVSESDYYTRSVTGG
jgi:hypothetical protein